MNSIALYNSPGLFRGIHHLERFASGAIPHRLPDDAVAFCTGLEPVKGLRARGGAGVRLAVRSTTRHVALQVSIVSRNDNRDLSCIAALKDGAGRLTCQAIPETETRGRWEWALPEGNQRFEIYFPWQCELELGALEIDDGTEALPLPKRPLLQLIGDSITEGMYAGAPETSYANTLGDILNMDILNSGVGGLKMEPEFVRLVLKPEADVVLLAFGVNDASLQKSPEQFQHDTDAVLSILMQYSRRKTYVLLPLIWPGEDHSAKFPLALYRNILRERASHFPLVHVIEGEVLLDDACGNFADGVHPNDQGMKKIATSLAHIMQE